ncbi:MAG: acylphosphatase [Eubacteriales bacterium]|nr:acylphosphatase [Eubacteriales bacterium]
MGSAGSGGSGNNRFERRHILFFGRVQGVGFRYHAMYGARNYGLTGWVENLSDGSVEMEVQGYSGAIDRMLSDIQKNGRWIAIDRIDSQAVPVVEDERGFRVRGY